MDPMKGHFSPINGLESINGIQFSLYGILTNLIFAHKDFRCGFPYYSSFNSNNVSIILIKIYLVPY